jgi:flagellar M-ring protein FliF
VDGLVKTLQGFGIGRLAAILGGAAGLAAVIAAVLLRVGTPSTALLYSNLDPKEASQVVAALDQAGIKHEEKGDGTTIMVDRDKVAQARLMVAGKGLVTSGSVGYEIFDNAPALGQTDFVQNLNMKRATEGELARTIRSIQGVQSARVALNLPKRQLFEQDVEIPSASVMVQTGARRLGAEQVRMIRNVVAASVSGLKPERVAVADQAGELLAGLDDASTSAAGSAASNDVEERIRKQVKDLVEGVVGPGKARVTVHADIDTNHVTTLEEKYDPDDQVANMTHNTSSTAKETKPGSSNTVTATNNVPGGGAPSTQGEVGNTNNGTDELSNFLIGKTTTTTVAEPGTIKKLSVSVAVDGVTGPQVKGKPGLYAPRSADEMAKLEQLVRSAVGADDKRGDVVKVVNVRFQPPETAEGGGGAASPLSLDNNSVLRIAELAVMLVVAVLMILFVGRPMMRSAGGGGSGLLPALSGPNGGGGAPHALAGASGSPGALPGAGGSAALLAGPAEDSGIDIARIEGQVRASSVRKVSEFVEKHPDESVAIIRSWLHES